MVACDPSLPKKSKKVTCFVSILPQSYFVKKIANDLVDVFVLLKPGDSPEKYDPSAKQLIQLSKAHCLFTIGIPFEKHLVRRLVNYDVPVVKTYKNISFLDGHNHSHDDEHNHDENKKDPHTWLDPTLAKKQVEVIAKKLIEMLPQHEKLFRRNLFLLKEELTILDQKIIAMMSNVSHKKIWVYHPAYAYFCKRYGLEQIAIETEGKEPTGKQLISLITQATQEKIRALFVQKQFMAKSPRTFINELERKYKEKNIEQKCQIVRIDPLLEDYSVNLLSMAKKIYKYLK